MWLCKCERVRVCVRVCVRKRMCMRMCVYARGFVHLLFVCLFLCYVFISGMCMRVGLCVYMCVCVRVRVRVRVGVRACLCVSVSCSLIWACSVLLLILNTL